MEGPRTLKRNELPSLSRLVDIVFRGQPDGGMFGQFPTLFSETNLDNLFVYVDGDTVVSHAGMTQGWASLAGCAVKVACIGAVATYEEYRGQAMASRLFAGACEKARADGVDIMMISGGKGLYRAAGAADVGCDFKARVDETAAAALADPKICLRTFTHTDLSVCAVAYGRKTAHFIRAAEDWESFFRTRAMVIGEQRMITVLRDGLVCGYLVCAGPNKEGRLEIVEFAGDDIALSGCPQNLLRETKAAYSEFHLQSSDTILRERFERVNAQISPACAMGTLLIINFTQLMERLRPLLEPSAAKHNLRNMRFAEDDGAFVFECSGQSESIPSRIEAAQRVFGHPDVAAWTGPLGRLFPVPSLWYGLNYI